MTLVQNMSDGRFKQFLAWRALAMRREHERLFRDGSHVPLAVTTGGVACDDQRKQPRCLTP